jgi:hypothetical protein
MLLLWMIIIAEMVWCLQDKKKQGAAYDDLSAQYEIDRSELEPLDHIPPLLQVGMNQSCAGS